LIEYEEAGGYYVHFSSVPRIGLFIRNKFGTPIGFYSYPLNKAKISSFATDREYAIVFKPKPEARLLDIGSYTEEDLERDLVKLQGLGFSREKMLDSARKARHQIPGGQLWNITREASQADQYKKYLGTIQDDDSRNLTRGGGPTGTWTTLLKRLGYDGVVDDGFGIIHGAEPSQAVFFSTTKLELVEVIDKKKNEEVGLGTFSRDFSDQDLSGKNFSGRKLESAIFRNAVLVGTNFTQAMMASANFYAANLQRAVFRNTNLKSASMVQVNATGAVFTDAVLEAAELEIGNFAGADFTNAFMWGLAGKDADFSGAIFRDAIMVSANLSGAVLDSAVLDGVSFTRASLQRATLCNASMKKVTLDKTNLWLADLRGADLTGAKILPSTTLVQATYNSNTKFPEGFDPQSAKMELEE
jgi:uncharacterized protein YjbI with pentapeptide repeats